MRPAKAAVQLSRVWRSICNDGSPYPVDCRLLAEALNIKVHSEPIDDDFEAMLVIRGTSRFIIFNENIREEGTKKICISHEIGHHCCHSNDKEYFCSMGDLNDMAPHPKNIEQEANFFAANLLMPADDFREQLDSNSVSLRYISRLADQRYKTSLTATCARLIDLSPGSAYGMVVVKGDEVVRWARTNEMRWCGFGFRARQKIPRAALIHNPDCEPIESEAWLKSKNAASWSLTQSVVHMPYYDQILVLIKAERDDEVSYLKEPVDDPTPSRIPSF